MAFGGRAHLLRLAPGRVTVDYGAIVRGVTAQPEPTEADATEVTAVTDGPLPADDVTALGSIS